MIEPVGVVAFTGHRNKRARESDLDMIKERHPNALWVHGGAEGFDSQVEMYARKHGITTQVYWPDFRKYGSPRALFERNERIVEHGEILYALYDGRPRGGTYHAINYAKKIGKPIIILQALKPEPTMMEKIWPNVRGI